jgi:hypothetical protein
LKGTEGKPRRPAVNEEVNEKNVKSSSATALKEIRVK